MHYFSVKQADGYALFYDPYRNHFGIPGRPSATCSRVHYVGWPPTDHLALDTVGTPCAVMELVPEPGTWAMMLLGFGAIGFSMRSRRRRGTALQIA